MPRIVSLWLPQWPVLRRLAAEQRELRAAERKHPPSAPVDPSKPFVIAEATEAAACIVAINPAARAAGLSVGMRLADARARLGSLQVCQADPAADRTMLERLAHWATRYTPSVALFDAHNGTDGLFLDVTGAAHLIGGEERLLADLVHRFASAGLPARLAIAETPGAAWALSHFARTNCNILEAGAEACALASLPVEALRLDPATALALRRLGFKRTGSLLGQHRAPFAARFEKELLLRLDQALGHTPEPLSFLAPPPAYTQSRTLLDPIDSEEAITTEAARLMDDLAPRLEADGAGASALCLTLYRVDGAAYDILIGLALPTRSPEHVARLIRLRLERQTRSLEAGYGFETLRLSVSVTKPMPPRQSTLTNTHEAERTHRCTLLHDVLRQRLGPQSVRHLAPLESHWPERSETSRAERYEASSWPEPHGPRPPLLLARPEPATVIALVPDGPPQRIRWRGRFSTVAGAEGPERIAAEWWRDGADAPTRDYYLVEETTGRRLWLYREGIPGREAASARWFVHGFFP